MSNPETKGPMTPQEIAALRDRLAKAWTNKNCVAGPFGKPEAFSAGFDACERVVAAPLRAENEQLKVDRQTAVDNAANYMRQHDEGLKELAEKEAALGKAETEEKALSRQITECMEFLIWLRGYEFIDGPIEDRLVKLLEALSSVQAGGKGDGT